MSIIIFLWAVLGLLLYFLPCFVAHNKEHSGAIFILNLLLGWTLVGWIVVLVWAIAAENRRKKYICPSCNSTVKLDPKATVGLCINCGLKFRTN